MRVKISTKRAPRKLSLEIKTKKKRNEQRGMEMYAFHPKHLPQHRSDQHTLSPYCIRRHFVK